MKTVFVIKEHRIYNGFGQVVCAATSKDAAEKKLRELEEQHRKLTEIRATLIKEYSLMCDDAVTSLRGSGLSRDEHHFEFKRKMTLKRFNRAKELGANKDDLDKLGLSETEYYDDFVTECYYDYEEVPLD